MDLAEKIIALHDALRRQELPHAFGGALALAWCTGRARGTIDIDVNIFVDPSLAKHVIASLPPGVSFSPKLQKNLATDGQVRLWWEKTPIDIFLNTVALHQKASQRVRWEDFAGQQIPFLACADLAIFKVFFNRTKDWADLEEMAAAGTLDIEELIAVINEALGPDDERITRLNTFDRVESSDKG